MEKLVRECVRPHNEDTYGYGIEVSACDEVFRYELFVDELPVWGFVGPPPEETKEAPDGHIWTHKSFDIDYNENRVSFQSTCPP